MPKHLSIHISDRSHVNITMNVYNCGSRELEREQFSKPDYYVFYFVKNGRGTFTQCQATHKVQAGQCFVVFPHEESMVRAEHGQVMDVTWVAFSGYLVDQYLTRAKLTAFEPVVDDTEDRELEHLFDVLMQVAVRPANRYCPILSQMYAIFGFLLDHTPQERRSESAPPEMHLLRALDFIDIYYQDDISVEDIANNVGLNRKALYTVFKQLTGFSTKDYLIYYRMRKATNLLKNTALSIETIATSVGYRDQFHFSKEFKKNVGFAPSEYRRVILLDPSKEYRAPIDRVRQQFPVVSMEEKPTHF